jgi:hypothetical protein
MRSLVRVAVRIAAAACLAVPLAALAGPWSVNGYLRPASGTSAKVLAVAVVVQNDEGGPATGLEPSHFAIDYLIPTPTTSLFFKGEISTQKPDGFAEQEPGMYVMYVTTTHNTQLVRGVSVRVFGNNGSRAQKASTFLPKGL